MDDIANCGYLWGMRYVRLLFAAGCVFSSTALFVACVGDTPVTNPPDASVGDSATQDTGTTPDSASEAAPPGDSGGDATAPCSNPVLGNSFATPTGASNAAFSPPSVGPLLSGDYKLTAFGFATGICFPAPCPYNPKAGSAFGGLRVTSLGGNSFSIERHVEAQQSKKTVLFDRFTGTYDQINRNLTVTRSCTVDGGSTSDAGTTWKTHVEVVDGSATGKVFLEVPDFGVEQVTADGSAGPPAAATGTFVKQ